MAKDKRMSTTFTTDLLDAIHLDMDEVMNAFSKLRMPATVLFFLSAVLTYAATKGDVDKGKEVFIVRCSPCHGDSGEGKEAIGKMYGAKMPALGSKKVQSLSDAKIRKIVLKGKDKMKPVSLSERELEDVIAFLRTLKK